MTSLVSDSLEEAVLGRQCSQCFQWKEWKFFSRNASDSTGYRAYCKNCQCKNKKKYLSTLDGKLKQMLNSAKRRAEKKNLPFRLTVEDLYSLVIYYCPITRRRIDWTHCGTTAGPDSPSLDKIVPELGYVPGNCAIISHRGNTIKSNGSQEEHRRIVKYMAEERMKHIVF